MVYFTSKQNLKELIKENIPTKVDGNSIIESYNLIENNHDKEEYSSKLLCSANRTRANERATSGRDRAYAAIEVETIRISEVVAIDHNGNNVYALVGWRLIPKAIARAYRRTAGIWFWAGTSELRLNINFGMKYRNASTIPNFSQNLVGHHVKVINWTGSITDEIPAISSDNPHAPFGFLNNANTKVSKTGTGEATINCNSTWTFFND